MAKRKAGAMPTSENKRALMQGVVESNIAEHGIHIYAVGLGEPGSYMYTVGNAAIGQPELFARCTKDNSSAINAIFNHFHTRGRTSPLMPTTLKCDGEQYVLRVPLNVAALKSEMLGAQSRYPGFEVLELVPPVRAIHCARPTTSSRCQCVMCR